MEEKTCSFPSAPFVSQSQFSMHVFVVYVLVPLPLTCIFHSESLSQVFYVLSKVLYLSKLQSLLFMYVHILHIFGEWLQIHCS